MGDKAGVAILKQAVGLLSGIKRDHVAFIEINLELYDPMRRTTEWCVTVENVTNVSHFTSPLASSTI